MNFLKSYPMLRLTIPLAAGIFLSDTYMRQLSYINEHVMVLVVLFVLLICFLPTMSYRFRWIYGGCLFVFLLVFGSFLTQLKWKLWHDIDWKNEKQLYQGILLESPVVKEKAVCLKMRIDNRDTYLYLMKDSASMALQMGEEILCYTTIQRPRNVGNPDEFDYATWLMRQGIYGTGVVSASQWKKTGRIHQLSLKQHSLMLRNQIIKRYEQWHFEESDFAILSALTVGYKENLSKELRNDFSIAGIGHLLALSGLHAGILWVLLSFLSRPLKRSLAGRILKWILLTFLLWGYAFMVGLSASIVRAVIMCMLIELGSIKKCKVSSLNIVIVTAFFMLIYNPFYLFDVGFQLSFLSVIFILLFYRRVYKVWQPKTKLFRYMWGVFSVSFIAQLATLPLVMYYFAYVSVYSLLANLLVAPLLPMIIYLALIILFMQPFPFIQSLFVFALKHVVHCLNSIVDKVSGFSYASISVVSISSIQVLLLYALVITAVIYLIKRRKKVFITLLSIVCVLLTTFLFSRINREMERSKIVFYNLRRCPSIHFIYADKSSYLWVTEFDKVENSFRYIEKTYWKRIGLMPPHVIGDTYRDHRIWNRHGLIRWNGKTICKIADDFWDNKRSNTPLNVDVLYICQGFKGRITSLRQLFTIRKVVMDASLNSYWKNRFQTECHELGLELFDLSEEGSYQILL